MKIVTRILMLFPTRRVKAFDLFGLVPYDGFAASVFFQSDFSPAALAA